MALPRFPRAREIVVLTAAASVCALAFSSTASADDNLNAQKQQLQQGISQSQGAVNESSAALAAATAQLTDAQARLAAANAKLAGIQSDLATAQATVTQLQAQLVQSQAALAAANASLAASTAAVLQERKDIGLMAARTMQQGDPHLLYLGAMLSSGTPAEITTQMGLARSVMQEQDARLADLRAKEALMNQQAAAVAAATAAVAQQKDAAVATVARIQGLQQAAAQQQASVTQLVAATAAAQQQAAAVRAHDQAVLQSLQAQEQAVEQQILERARRDANRSFSGNGMLLRPVPDAVTSPFGYRVNPIEGYYGLHNGVDFAANCGEPQVASDSGTVISEYYSAAWGNRLYIDLGNINGHNYTVIYNHLAQYAVGTGQSVSRGQVIGRTGTTGWSTGCHLHFTVMRDGVAVDPMQFF